MKIKSVELETVCGITSKLPENDKMEIKQTHEPERTDPQD